MARLKGMTQAERDQLTAGGVAALERLAGVVERIATHTTREGDEKWSYRGLPVAPMFAGESGLRALHAAWPQVAECWLGEGSVQLPDSHLAAVSDVAERSEAPMAICKCGSATVLTPFEGRACAGGCGRWFLSLPSGVRVRKLDQAQEVEAA
jgi:hypothetical protein